MMKKLRNIFKYSNVSRWHIVFNTLRFVFLHIIGKRFVIAPVNDYCMELDLNTPGLSRTLFVYGTRELLDTHLVQKEIGGDMNVLDVGANIGYYAIMEASQLTSGRVYAFEPDPRNIELLQKNIKLNNLENKITVFPYAASNVSEEGKRFHLGERTNVSSFVERGDEAGTAEVECVKLDDLPYIDTIDFIRMDIEGYECKVLEGARNFLTHTKKPVKILLEVHTFAYNKTDMDFAKQLQFLADNQFVVRYVIATEKGERLLNEEGLASTKEATERGRTKYLFEDVPIEHTLELLEHKGIRSLMLQKNI